MKWIEAVEHSCRASLSAPEHKAVLGWLERRQRRSELARMASAVTEVMPSQDRILALKKELIAANLVEPESITLEQCVLLEAVLGALPRLGGIRVGEAVMELLREAFLFMASPDPRSTRRFLAGGSDFASMCKIATLSRFPAGQFEWEVSGLPRSWLTRIEPASLPRLITTLLTGTGGFRPLFFPHFAACGQRRIVMLESEVRRSFYRMAAAMEMQPEVRGLLAASWFFAPQVARASPHLAWLLPIFSENGGFVSTMGPTDGSSGVFAGSVRRRELHEKGDFEPTMGIVLWPRKAMLRWAAAHPELSRPAERITPGKTGVPGTGEVNPRGDGQTSASRIWSPVV